MIEVADLTAVSNLVSLQDHPDNSRKVYPISFPPLSRPPNPAKPSSVTHRPGAWSPESRFGASHDKLSVSYATSPTMILSPEVCFS